MSHPVLSIGSVVLISMAAVMLFAAWRTRKRVLEVYREIDWSRQQIARALEMLSSPNADEVINGLQTVRALGIANGELLDRVEMLLSHDDRRVVEHAQDALLALSRRGVGEPKEEKPTPEIKQPSNGPRPQTSSQIPSPPANR